MAVATVVLGVLGASAGWGEEALGVGIGSWLAGVGVLLWIGRVLRDREERGTGPRGRLVTRTLDGERATVLHQHPARHLFAAVFAAYATVPFAAPLVAAWFRSDESRLGAAAMLGVLLMTVGLVVGGQVRRARRAGVWLTPTALVVRERDVTSRAAWANVRWISEPSESTATVTAVVFDRSAVSVVARRRREQKFRAMFGDVIVPTRSLVLDADELVGLLRTCMAPGVADRLGTEAGLMLVRGAHRPDTSVSRSWT